MAKQLAHELALFQCSGLSQAAYDELVFGGSVNAPPVDEAITLSQPTATSSDVADVPCERADAATTGQGLGADGQAIDNQARDHSVFGLLLQGGDECPDEGGMYAGREPW
jgi:hypothetical protein